LTFITPADDGAVTAKLLNVLLPVTGLRLPWLEVKATLRNVKPGEVMPDVEPDRLICDVPALNVRFVALDMKIAEVVLAEIVTVELAKSIALTSVPVDCKGPAQVTDWPFV
jgi:hypothetical protein